MTVPHNITETIIIVKKSAYIAVLLGVVFVVSSDISSLTVILEKENSFIVVVYSSVLAANQHIAPPHPK